MGMFKSIGRAVLKSAVEAKLLLRIREHVEEMIIGRCARRLWSWTIPVQPNKVLFHTQEDRYCCNQKYICEEFLRRNLGENIDLVYVVPIKGGRGTVPKSVRTVNRGKYNYFKEMFSAQYVFTNSVLYVKTGFKLKRNQVLFETWHGSLGIKRFDKDSYKSSWKWVKGAIDTGKMTTYCISNSTFEEDVYRNSYWPNTECLRYGHPRNDIMFENYKEVRDEVKKKFIAKYGEKYGVAESTRFVMYAPTFRDSKDFDCYDVDFEGVLEALRERFGGEWKMLLRYHMTLRKVYKKRENLGKKSKEDIIDVTEYDDMQELISLADIAITDYSSWIYDFVLQRRPGFIFATDIDLYNNERGFCYPLETTPFAIAIDNEQLLENIRNFNQESYAERVEQFLLDKGCMEDGHASERTVDKVLEMMGYDQEAIAASKIPEEIEEVENVEDACVAEAAELEREKRRKARNKKRYGKQGRCKKPRDHRDDSGGRRCARHRK